MRLFFQTCKWIVLQSCMWPVLYHYNYDIYLDFACELLCKQWMWPITAKIICELCWHCILKHMLTLDVTHIYKSCMWTLFLTLHMATTINLHVIHNFYFYYMMILITNLWLIYSIFLQLCQIDKVIIITLVKDLMISHY